MTDGSAPKRRCHTSAERMITREGRRQLEAQVAEWEHSSRAVNRVLRFAPQGA